MSWNIFACFLNLYKNTVKKWLKNIIKRSNFIETKILNSKNLLWSFIRELFSNNFAQAKHNLSLLKFWDVKGSLFFCQLKINKKFTIF